MAALELRSLAEAHLKEDWPISGEQRRSLAGAALHSSLAPAACRPGAFCPFIWHGGTRVYAAVLLFIPLQQTMHHFCRNAWAEGIACTAQ